MRGSGEWKGAIHKNVRTWAYGKPLNLADEARTLPGSGRPFARRRGHCAHSGVVRLSGALGVITCWANTRVGLIVMRCILRTLPVNIASWLELMGANLEVGRKGRGGSTFSISSFASSLCCAQHSDEGSPLQKIKNLCKIFSPPR